MPPVKNNDVKVSQKKKDECNARAQTIVLKFIDGVEDEEQFLEQLRWVNQNHYQDINEERAIMKVCGYPICEQILGLIPKKKYHISVSQNKVYDITERKLFCSNQCYKASLYLKRQLHTGPLWFGDRDECETFTLMKSDKELIGEVINFEIDRAKEPEDPLESEDAVSQSSVTKPPSADSSNTKCLIEEDQSSCSELSYAAKSDNMKAVTKSGPSADDSTVRIHLESDQPSQPPTTSDSNAAKLNHKKSVTQNDIIERPTSDSSIIRIHVESDNRRFKRSNATKSDKQKTVKCKLPTRTVDDSIRHIEQSMREWMTVESLRFILGEQNVIDPSQKSEQVLDRKDKETTLEAVSEPLSDLKAFEEPTPESVSQPLADFEALKKQTEEMAMKVEEFYRGDRKVAFVTNEKKDTADKEVEKVYSLPLIHHYDQNSTRRNIVLSKLKLIFPNLCAMLALDLIDISSKVKQLVYTCRFSAHNITFKPLEWNLIGLILLKLLSVQDHSIQNHLQNKSNYVNALLESYYLKTSYLDSLTTWLTDVEFIKKNEDAS